VVQDESSTTPAKEEIHPVLPCLIGIDASFPTQIHSTSTNEVSSIQALKLKDKGHHHQAHMAPGDNQATS
jgi:hypothetical protein